MLNYFKSASCLFDLNSIATTKKKFAICIKLFKMTPQKFKSHDSFFR